MADVPARSIRQRIAANTPGGLRKAVRMALNYLYRLRTWAHLLAELSAADGRSRVVLWTSALAAPITALHDLDTFRTPRLIGDMAVKVPGVGRFDVRANTDDLLHVMPSREPWVRKALEAELSPGGIMVDGGANIGFYSILAARLVGATGKVVAFEMMPDTAAILRSHINSNGDLPISVVEGALSARSGERVTASVEPGLHGQASIVTEQTGTRISVNIETVSLDDSLAGFETIDFLKLDLEGAEFTALSGAEAVLARTRCLVFESNDEDPRIFGLLGASGFKIERLGGCDFVARRDAELGARVLA